MHTPGKLLYTEDTLSHTLQPTEDHDLLDEAESFVEAIVSTLPATTQQLDAYQKAQADDSVCRKVMDYCHTQWSQKSPTDRLLGIYWKVQDSLSIYNDLHMNNLHIVVPLSLQETLQKVHEGHQGIVRCKMRTKMSVWWPGISKQVEEFVQRCPICARDREPRWELQFHLVVLLSKE